MKIKEIINEGFVSSFAKALLPSGLQKAIDPDVPAGRYTEFDLAKAAYERYGKSPDYDEEEATRAQTLKDPVERKKYLDLLGIQSWYTRVQKDIAKNQDKRYVQQATQELPKAGRAAIINPAGAAAAMLRQGSGRV